MGSYLLVAEKKGFVPVRYPVWMERCGQAEGKIRLFRRGMVPEDFLLIPAGKYIMGSSSGMADAVEQCTPYVEDFFIARNPVTFGEYLAFLNDLVLEHPRTARRHVPRRTSGKPFWKLGPDGGYFLPEKDAEGDRHLPDYPILGVSWEDACAYVKWKSGKDGVPYRLPYEVEWEKAARGVDGRLYPWGNRFDPAFCDIRQTHAERPMPELVGDFRKDESPYGVRHMAGNMRNWCADHFFDGRQYWAVVRGGSWQGSEYSARVSYRNQFLITHTDSQTGFRLCFTPEEGAPGAQGAEAKDETSRQKSYNT
jgi:formylglycine-generating enzyme required for sulfatase activity